MNKYAITPWGRKSATPGEMSEKMCNFEGGIYKKIPGEKSGNQPGETYEKICLHINITAINKNPRGSRRKSHSVRHPGDKK